MNDKKIKVCEMFHGVQGEGPLIGRPVIFIRLYGCVKPYCIKKNGSGFNCDSMYAVEGDIYKEMKISDIIERIKLYKPLSVVITGGEPFAQENIWDLYFALEDEKYLVQFETSGKAYFDTNNINPRDLIVMSPKQYNGEFIIDKDIALKQVDYFKFVLSTEREFQNILYFIKNNDLFHECIYLMPAGMSRKEQEKNLPFVIEKAIEYNFRVSPRLHIMAYGNKRGV